MRVQLRHLIEQLLVGRRGLLQPIEVLQVTLGVLDRRGRVGRARLLVTGDNHRRVQRRQPVQRRDPILSALGGGVADVHAALVVHNVASDDQADRWNVERRRIGTIGAALLDDAQFVALESERVVLIGLRWNQLGGHLPRKHPAGQPLHCGSERHLHGLHRLGRCDRPSARETVEQNAQTVEVVEMGVRYIDGLQVAVVQSNPIRESLGLSHRPHRVHQHRVVLAEDQSRRDRVKAERFAEGLWPLADHGLSRGGKNVHTKRVRRDGRGHARGLFQSICAVHSVPLSMSERVTVQGKIGRSATTNPLDEGID